jgi:hypothetical protein
LILVPGTVITCADMLVEHKSVKIIERALKDLLENISFREDFISYRNN